MDQDLPESQREDAVKSLVYEARARLRDPVYGSAGIVFELQKRVVELQGRAAMAEAELLAVRSQQANLLALMRMKMDEPRVKNDEEQGLSWERLLWA